MNGLSAVFPRGEPQIKKSEGLLEESVSVQHRTLHRIAMLSYLVGYE